MAYNGTLAFMGRALRYRNYRLFFAGQAVSIVGSWMSVVATSWLVYRLTGSTVKLGLVGFAGQIPAFLLSPLAGLAIDRWDTRKVFIATQALSLLQALALAVLTLSGTVTFAWLIALSVAQGLVNAFDMPCRHTFVNSVIENKEDLPNAIALNSSLFHGGRMVGPAAAGLLIASVGEGVCFLIDAASFLPLLLALLVMRVPGARRAPREAGAWEELREGLVYTWRSRALRSIILMLAAVSFVAFPYTVLMPAFVSGTLAGGPQTLGFLMTASGFGALAGSLWLASRRSVLGLGGVGPASAGVLGAALLVFSASRSTAVCLALMPLVGGAMLVTIASGNTILQTIVDDDKRGRVMSLFMMAFLGAAPLGSLAAGGLAERAGVPATLAVGGVCCLAAAAWYARELPAIRRETHPIYARLGILPEPSL